jgi:hypothetical protein
MANTTKHTNSATQRAHELRWSVYGDGEVMRFRVEFGATFDADRWGVTVTPEIDTRLEEIHASMSFDDEDQLEAHVIALRTAWRIHDALRRGRYDEARRLANVKD